MLCKGLNISSYRISWFIDIFHISLFQKSLFGLFFRRAIEFSSKCFTQIHHLFIPLRKSNNAVKFTVSLKQNSLEDFTTNGFLKILSWHLRPLNFAQNALAQLWTKTWTSIPRKICYMSGLQVVYEVEQFSSLFFLGNYAIELMEFKLFFAKKMAVYAPRKKI